MKKNYLTSVCMEVKLIEKKKSQARKWKIHNKYERHMCKQQ